METPLFLILLALVCCCKGDNWVSPTFCHNQQCPQYEVIETNKDFETRLYVATNWITTKIKTSGSLDMIAADSRLRSFCKIQKNKGKAIPIDTWPVLVTNSKNESELFLSWFLPPGIPLPENSDPTVSVQTKSEGIVYVRVFGGKPSIETGKDNARRLREVLNQAGKSFDHDNYFGAGYDSFFSITYHNEIWITAA